MDSRSEKFKLTELKYMTIGVWLLKNRSTDDWNEYARSKDAKWIEQEGLSTLLTEETIDLLVDNCEEEIWSVFGHFISSSSVSTGAVQSSLVRLCTSVSDRMGRGDDECWKGHRVVCWVMSWMLGKCDGKWSDESAGCVMNYLAKVLECEDMELVKWAILAGERLCCGMKLSSERRNPLRTLIQRLEHTNMDLLEIEMGLDDCDAERYQVGWCARWCEDNLMKRGVDKIPRVKLSSDRFEARCDDFGYSPIRCSFPVKSNVYFFEVKLVNDGKICIGWSTRKAELLGWGGIGDDEYSIGLEVSSESGIYHNSEQLAIVNSTRLNSGNVVGCLIDVTNQQFEFYLNGKAIQCPTKVYFSSQPYFATATLAGHQQCHFNFGQSPFKYPPQNVQFTTFDEQSRGNESKYKLLECKSSDSSRYWFTQLPIDNQVNLFYADEIQDEIDRYVLSTEVSIQNDQKFQELKPEKIVKKQNGSNQAVRYIQSIVEVMGKVIGDDKVDVMAQWIVKQINEIYPEKLIELLYPYLQLVHTKSTLIKHRSICIVLTHLIKSCRQYRYDVIKHIHKEVFTYLTRILSSSSDHWTQLFVLIALRDLDMSQAEKRQIEGSAEIGQMVQTWRNQFEGKNVVQLLNSKQEHRMHYQLYTCWYNLANSLTPQITSKHLSDSLPTTLNPLDLTPQLTLSPCHLSARSDWKWQSVRSVCSFSADIYYYEVVLLTAGPMTLGWATKIAEQYKSTEIGRDEFFIGFDGYNRSINRNNKTFQLDNIPRWKAGDIVGCLIDYNRHSFIFYLNGSQIGSNAKFDILNQPYHALISLSQFQQCYCNFGQTPFSSIPLPEHDDLLNFHSKKFIFQDKRPMQKLRSFKANGTNLLPTSYTSIIDINSNIKCGDVKILKRSETHLKENNKRLTNGFSKSASHSKSVKRFRPNTDETLDKVIDPSFSQCDMASIASTSQCTNIDQSIDQVNESQNETTNISTEEFSKKPIRLTHNWTIENFESFFKKGSTPLSVIYSDPFPASDAFPKNVHPIQFSLRLLPSFKDEESKKDTFASIYLYNESSVFDAVTVKYKITIINEKKDKNLTEDNGRKIQIFRLGQFWGKEKFVNLKKLLNVSEGFLSNGQLTIHCEVKTDAFEICNLKPTNITSPDSRFDCNVKVTRFAYTWKIKKFGSLFYLVNQKSPNSSMAQTSPKFQSRQNKNQTDYYLRLWPKGIDESSQEFVALYIYLESQTTKELSVHYQISILNWKNEIYHSGENDSVYLEGRFEKIQPLQIGSNKLKKRADKIKLDRGSPRYIAQNDVLNIANGLLPDDTLTVHCEIEEFIKA